MAILQPQPAVPSNTYFRKILRRWWKTLHVIGGRPVADILRYDETGGDPSAGIAPTSVLVANLNNLLVAVSTPGQLTSAVRGKDFAQIQENEREFIFLDIPLMEGVSNTIQATDRILFEGKRWKPRIVFNDTILGLSSAISYLETR